jgi:hypothetical protein
LDEDRAVLEQGHVASPGHSLPTTSTWLGPSGYERLVARIRGVVRAMVPASATVLVVSKGDDELLQLDGRPAWHFPRGKSGRYAGHHPATSEDAIQHLESLREQGANYLLFPCTAFWWLGHYGDLAQHLIGRYQLVHADNDTCVVFGLNGHEATLGGETREARPERYTRFVDEVRDVVRSVLPDDATVLVISSGDDELLDLGSRRARHFPQADDGGYAGFHPADSAEAILHLEKLLRGGAEYLVIPETEYWWLDHYSDFRRHLDAVHRLVLHQAHVCTIYELRARFRPAGPSGLDLEAAQQLAEPAEPEEQASEPRVDDPGAAFQRFRKRLSRFWDRS